MPPSFLRAIATALLLTSAFQATSNAQSPSPKASSAPPTVPPAIFSEVDAILASLSEITGWKVKHKVPSETLAKEKFAKMVADGTKDAEKDKGVHATELTLKMFGLAPWDFNLAKESGDLITEQAAAFYDYKKKRLFVMDTTQGGDETEQRVALAHELAHALADQQYELHKYLSGGKYDDEETARQAVIEGQASWLSWAYLSKRNGGPPEVPKALVERLADSAGAQGDNFPVLTQTPLYMRESLVFPYTEGMRFIDAAFRDTGKKSFDEVFQHPPMSTQQIIHPSAYQHPLDPTHPKIPKVEAILTGNDAKDAKQWKQLIDGDVGEFDYSAMLRQYVDDAKGRDTARHWRGGAYALYEKKGVMYPILVHVSDWDSPDAARDFFLTYAEVLKRKWKNMQLGDSKANELSGTGDTGGFRLRLQGSSVECIEGLPSSGAAVNNHL